MLTLRPLPERPQAVSGERAALSRDLLAMADEFEEKARELRDRAAQLGAHEDLHKATEDRMALLWSSPEVVQGFLDEGLSLEEAQGAASVETGCRLDSIEFHWRRNVREEKRRLGSSETRRFCGYLERAGPAVELLRRLFLRSVQPRLRGS